MTELPPPPEGYEGLDQPPSAKPAPSPPDRLSIPAPDHVPIEAGLQQGQESVASSRSRSKRRWLWVLGLVAVAAVAALTVVALRSLPVSNWDYSASYQENAVALVGEPIDDDHVDRIEGFNRQLGRAGLSVNEDYWASYVMWSQAGCNSLNRLFDDGVSENWSVDTAAATLDEVVYAISDVMREDTPGFRTSSIGERYSVIAAAFAVGECDDVYVDWATFIGDPGPLPSLLQ